MNMNLSNPKGTYLKKFNPTIKYDENSEYRVKRQDITSLEEYESDSFEELRFQDYIYMKKVAPCLNYDFKCCRSLTNLLENDSSKESLIPSKFNSPTGNAWTPPAMNTSSLFIPSQPINVAFSNFKLNSESINMGTPTKFKAPIRYESTPNGRNVGVVDQCITMMKEYSSKSIEELRYEDYSCGRKRVEKEKISSRRILHARKGFLNIGLRREQNDVITEYKELNLLGEILTTQQRIINKVQLMSVGLTGLIRAWSELKLRQLPEDKKIGAGDEDKRSESQMCSIVFIGVVEKEVKDAKTSIVQFLKEKLHYIASTEDVLDVVRLGKGTKSPVIVHFKNEKIANDVLELSQKLVGSKYSMYRDCCSD